MSAFDKLTSSQKIRAAVHRDVRAISSETCHFLGLEVTESAMEIIAELVYRKLSVYGADLEAFAKHAKRTVISSEDVKLLVRRNPSLHAHLNTIAPATNQTNKRRKTTAKPKETPAKTAEAANKNKEDSSANKEDKSTEQKQEENSRMANLNTAIEDAFADMAVDDITIDLTFE